MKVMLINPSTQLIEYNRIYKEFASPVPPLGISSMASVLEENSIDVIVVDQYANGMTVEGLVQKIKQEKPQIIGLSCLTPGMDTVQKIVEQVRALNENILVILGNTHATIFAENLLRQRTADVVIRGEGELSLLEVVLAMREGKGLHGIRGISFAENGIVHENPDREQITDLDTLPYPAWHLFELKQYRGFPLLCLYDTVLPIQASRGCPYKCIFCAQDSIFKRTRYRQTKKVVDEIEYMYNRYNVRNIGFIDANFPISISQGFEFCNELIRRGLNKKIRWITETRVDLVSAELLKAMKESGLFLMMYGFEVGNTEILKSLKKQTTLQQARKAMYYTKKAKILTLGLFMLGMPGETKRTCEETINFAKELDCDIVKFNLVVPYPGSELYQRYKDRINVMEHPEKFTGWNAWMFFTGDTIFVPDGMEQTELVNLQRKAMFSYYVRLKLILKHILKGTISLKNLFYGGYILFLGYFKFLFDKLRPNCKCR